jgi:hypothetical protein
MKIAGFVEVSQFNRTYYNANEEVEFGNSVSFYPALLGHQNRTASFFGFKIETKNTNTDKIFIDYQINYKDLHGKKYTVLYSYCILTVKNLNSIKPLLADYRLIIDGIDITSGRTPLIMPYKTIYPEESDN